MTTDPDEGCTCRPPNPTVIDAWYPSHRPSCGVWTVRQPQEAAVDSLCRMADEAQQQPGRVSCPDPIECGHEAALGQAQQEVRRLGLMVDEYSAGASALTDKLKRIRDMHRETCILARGEIGRTAFKCGMCEVLDAPAAVAQQPAADEAGGARRAADEEPVEVEADAYDKRITAPPSAEACTALRDRLESGTVARRTVQQDEGQPS